MKNTIYKIKTILISTSANLLISTLILISMSSFAQAPQKMSYQAVIRNSSNVLIASTAVGMQISILQGSSTGTAIYVETQTPTTNINGLATIEIGTGTVVTGNFSTINWASGPYFIKTETDPTGGTSYSITGNKELISVPYALYAANGGMSGVTGATGNDGNIGFTGSTGITGNNGNDGSTGATGSVGFTGATGANGGTGISGDLYSTTSCATTLTVPVIPGTSQNLTVGNGLAYTQGQQVVIAMNANITITALVTFYDPSTGNMVVQEEASTGAATFTSCWTVNLTGMIGSTGSTGSIGSIGSTGLTGSTGSTGTIGITGSTGSMGATGSIGNIGSTGGTGFLQNGFAAGNTPYWNGTNWITNSSNIYNNGGNVGINTSSPNATAALHVDLGSSLTNGILITGTENNASSTVPNLGAGTRMMFYPGKAAFRVGSAIGTEWDNANVGLYSTAIGYNPTASGTYSTAIGFSNTASGFGSTAIGYGNTASGNNGTIAMGNNTTASGDNSTAMGVNVSTNAKIAAFIIGDASTGTITNSSVANEMTMRFAGGYRLFSNAALTAGVTLAAGGGSWASVSDKRKKENFKPLNAEDILLKIKNMPVTEWNYKAQDKTNHHIGPMAQDFYAAFKLSGIGNDTTITSSDIDGVNMIAIQALEKRTAQLKLATDELEKLKAEVDTLKQNNSEFKNRFIKLENEMDAIQQRNISARKEE